MRLHLLRAGPLPWLAVTLLAMPLPGHAADQAIAPAERQFGPIMRAVLKVIPPADEWRFSRGLLESDLQDFACEYELLDLASTAALRNILNRTEFADDHAKAPEFSVLIGIYLSASDGKATKLLVGQAASDGSTRGTIDGQRVLASRRLERELRNLVAAMAPKTIRYTCGGGS